MKLKRLTAKVFLPNKASARVLEKNGFKLEGILKKDLAKGGKYYDVYLFARVK
jgi:RimJ/RimL family protein N-acetyltransferase